MEHCRVHFMRITRFARRFQNRHSIQGLKDQEIRALRSVSFHHQVSQQQIADTLGIDKSLATRLIQKLEERGYLTREINPEDRREKLITATAKADAVRQQNSEVTDLYYEWLLSALSEKERKDFLATLLTLSERASAAAMSDFAELEAFYEADH